MEIVLAIIGLLIGIGAGYIIANQLQKKKTDSESNQILKEARQEAENIKKEKKIESVA